MTDRQKETLKMLLSSTGNNEKYLLKTAKDRYMIDIKQPIKSIIKDLRKAVKIEERELNKKSFEEKKVKAKRFKIKSVAELERLESKAYDILGSFWSNYSMGDYLRLHINGEFFVLRDNTKSYQGKYKGSENHGHVNIYLTLSDLRKIEKIGGVWTIRKPNNKCTILDASGYKGTYKVFKNDIYLIKDSHGNTYRQAFDRYIKKKEQDIKRLREQRKYNSILEERKDILIDYKYMRNYGCHSGIVSFASKHRLNIEESYSIGFLLSLEPKNQWLQNALHGL